MGEVFTDQAPTVAGREAATLHPGGFDVSSRGEGRVGVRIDWRAVCAEWSTNTGKQQRKHTPFRHFMST